MPVIFLVGISLKVICIRMSLRYYMQRQLDAAGYDAR